MPLSSLHCTLLMSPGLIMVVFQQHYWQPRLKINFEIPFLLVGFQANFAKYLCIFCITFFSISLQASAKRLATYWSDGCSCWFHGKLSEPRLDFRIQPERTGIAPSQESTERCKQKFVSIVAIRKPERKVVKASHCGSKQQYRSHAMIACSRHIYMYIYEC